MPSESKQIAKNTAIQLIGKVVSTLLGVFSVALLARFLGVEGYGQFTIIMSFLAIFAVMVDFGLTITTVSLISEQDVDEEKMLGNLLSLRIISSILFLSLAPIVALFFPYPNVIKWGIAIGASLHLFTSTAAMLVGVFQKYLDMGKAVLGEFANRAFVFIALLLAPTLNLGLIGVVWIFVLSNALMFLIDWYYARKYIRIRFAFDKDIVKHIFATSWPIGASIFFNLIYLRGDVLFLSLFRTESEIGQYGIAYKVLDVMTAIPTMFMGLMLPILVASWSAKNGPRFKEKMQESLDFLSFVGIPFVFGCLLLGVPTMIFIAGPEYEEAGKIMWIFGAVITVLFYNTLFGHAIIAINKQKQMMWGYALVATITIIGYIATIPTYGIWAAAWWTLIAELLIGVLTYIMVYKTSGYRPRPQAFYKAILASLLMSFGILIVHWPHVIFDILFGGIIYVLALHFLGGVDIRNIPLLFLPERPISEP